RAMVELHCEEWVLLGDAGTQQFICHKIRFANTSEYGVLLLTFEDDSEIACEPRTASWTTPASASACMSTVSNRDVSKPRAPLVAPESDSVESAQKLQRDRGAELHAARDGNAGEPEHA